MAASRPQRSELLMPAGNLRCLKTALLYGADAIYAGTPDLSLRTHSDFPLEDLAEGIELVHASGKRIYLTLNLYAHNRDIARLPEFVSTLRRLRPDGVIVADPGVFAYLAEHAPELERHVSTQANVTSWHAARFWQQQGASLCVLAREVSFEELCEIRERCPDLKLETFIHGAICMTYSGRCLLSNYLAERGSNQGSCAHSCRWKYQLKVRHADGSEGQIEINDGNMSDFQFFLEEEFRPGQLYPIEEDARGSYILNARDLCLMPKLDRYLRLGVDSLKVEGRNKNEYYVAVVARAYRQAIDAYYADPEAWDPAPFLEELQTARARGYTLGFHEGRLSNLAHDYDNGQSLSAFEFAGFVRQWQGDDLIFEIRNRLVAGDVIEFLLPEGLDCIRLRLYEFTDADTGARLDKVSAGQGRAIRIGAAAFERVPADALRTHLPPQAIGRKRSVLSEAQWHALQAARDAQKTELGLLSPEALRRPKLESAVRRSPPRLGPEGCCGLGCNGCLPFWHDPKYATAREKWEQRGPGSRRRGV